jgi:hypothetical protein
VKPTPPAIPPFFFCFSSPPPLSFFQLVASLAAGSEHILKQQGMITEMCDRLAKAARGREPVASNEVEVLLMQGSTVHTLHLIVAAAFSRSFFNGQVRAASSSLRTESSALEPSPLDLSPQILGHISQPSTLSPEP